MKRIVLTGAAKDGYGEAILRKLVDNGYFVYGTYEEELADKAENLQKELKNVKLYSVDHSKRSSLARLIEKIEDDKIEREILFIVFALKVRFMLI